LLLGFFLAREFLAGVFGRPEFLAGVFGIFGGWGFLGFLSVWGI